MSDTSSSPSQESERNLPPGHSWLEIIKRRTPEAFAAAFYQRCRPQCFGAAAPDFRRCRPADLLRSDPGDVRHHRFQARGDPGIANLFRVGRDVNGMVRPRSCRASKQSWRGATNRGSTRCPRSSDCVATKVVARPGGNAARQHAAVPDRDGSLRRCTSSEP